MEASFPKKIVIVGAGAFGTALSMTCYHACQWQLHQPHHHGDVTQSCAITFLVKDDSQAIAINNDHRNPLFRPEFKLPHCITATTDIGILKDAEVVIFALPTQTLFSFCQTIKDIIPPHVPVILTSKGLVHLGSNLDQNLKTILPMECVGSLLKNPLAILAGPNFATELMDGLPAAACLAFEPRYDDVMHHHKIMDFFRHPRFRLYLSHDPTGVQIAGIVKNVIAIGCGVLFERNLGQNALAALITRGLAEMTRLGLSMGASLETFLGLSGVGDLTLTCSSPKSRNFSLGQKLSQNQTIDTILKSGHPLSEGYHSLPSLLHLAEQHHVDMPLCLAIDQLLKGNSVDDIIDTLFHRPPRMDTFSPFMTKTSQYNGKRER